MTLKTILCALGASLVLALPASAECYADYRAQQSNPVRFHYGVVQLPDSVSCNAAAAASYLQPRLAQNGWTLSNVLSTFGPEGLGARRNNAGQYYLRF
ncbi:hypothetical protein [Pararhodobacter sp.]|uniref:hypothetical protein n=1 Tax=Pararhodobacter sp. TaxID=2127056 RepID=UPI002B002D9C|nr:hypothetical protein [Pararhodobacter sp.]